MRTALLALIAITAAGYSGIVLFFAWFTLALFGASAASLVVAALLFTVGPVVAYAADRWRRVRRGEAVRV